MTSTAFEGITISSQFIGICKRLDNSGYGTIYDMLYPKYTITINNETFEYSQSASYLADAIGVKQDRTANINDVSNKFAQSKACELSDKDMLFALRAILEDALVGFQFYTPGEFGKEFGYTDIDECIEVFNACNQTRVKLRFSETKIHELLEKLSEEGIE